MGVTMQADESLPVEASQDATVVTEESSTPEVLESETPEATEDKKSKGVQKRIDELTANWRNEQREKEWLRQQYEMLQQQVQTPKQPEPVKAAPQGRPSIDQFEDVNDFVEAVSDWKLRQYESTREASSAQEREQREQQALISKVNQSIDKARQKYADFDDVVTNNANVAMSTATAIALTDMAGGMDVAYHLGRNPAEAQRIANLPQSLQFVEIGKIEAALTANTRKTTTAPPPVGSQLAGSAGGGEPKDIKEWMAWRNEQLRNRQK